MTISLAGATGVSTTSAARGTTSTSVAYTAVAAGRLAIITAAVKPSTAAWGTDPAGWSKVVDATGGTGTNAADTGTSRIGKWCRVLDGTETGSVTITATNTPSQVCGAMDVYSNTAGGWDTPIAVTGADTTHGTNPSAASGTWASALAVGDYVHVGYATDTDSTTATTGQAITQTSTTFGTVTARSRVGNSDGNDGSVFTWDAEVTAGGAATATTMTLTWSGSSCGAFGALRIREQAPTALTQTVVDDFDDNSIGAGWSNWGGAQVTESSARLNLTTTTTGVNYYGIERVATVDVAGVAVGAKIIAAGNMGLASYSNYVSLTFSSGNQIYWSMYQNNVRCFQQVASTSTQVAVMPYISSMHQYLAIGESGGQIQFLWSTDGAGWVVHHSIANPFAGDTTVTPYFMVGTDAAEATTTTFQVDDYSTWAANTATNAPADTATATGAAYDAAADVAVPAGEAAGTGQAHDAAVALGVNAGAATASGGAFDATTAAGPSSVEATATGQAFDATTAIGGNATTATATGAAHDATVSTAAATNAPADTAAASGAAFDTSAAVGINAATAAGTGAAFDATAAAGAQAGTATGTGTALDAQTALGALAAVATATGAAFDASVGFEVAASAGTAAATGQAFDASTAIAAGAATAAGVGEAYDPTVSTSSATNAPAGTATAAGTAYDATVALDVLASTASAVGAAYSPAIGLGILAGVAVGTGQAYDPTVNTTTATNAPAEIAAAAGAAFDATVAISVSAATAAAVGQAFPASVSLGSAITPRPFTGTTAQPGAGTTIRPFTGITPRP